MFPLVGAAVVPAPVDHPVIEEILDEETLAPEHDPADTTALSEEVQLVFVLKAQSVAAKDEAPPMTKIVEANNWQSGWKWSFFKIGSPIRYFGAVDTLLPALLVE